MPETWNSILIMLNWMLLSCDATCGEYTIMREKLCVLSPTSVITYILCMSVVSYVGCHLPSSVTFISLPNYKCVMCYLHIYLLWCYYVMSSYMKWQFGLSLHLLGQCAQVSFHLHRSNFNLGSRIHCRMFKIDSICNASIGHLWSTPVYIKIACALIDFRPI